MPTIELNQTLVNQNQHNLLPFMLQIDSDFVADGSQIQFLIRTSRSSYLDYDGVITPSPGTVTAPSTYTPNDTDEYYQHEPIFYIDMVISGETSGAKDVDLRAETSRYGFNDIHHYFTIPKFSWSNALIRSNAASESSYDITYTHLSGATGSVWIGTENKKVHKIEYQSNAAGEAYSLTLDSEVELLEADDTSGLMFITTYDNLYSYSFDHYIDQAGQYVLTANQETKLYNANNEKIVYVDDSELWTVSSYFGKIIKRDRETLEFVLEVNGFDAPFKIVKSNYHGCNFVAGTNVLWKVTGTTKEAVYEVNNYKIIDFDVSTNGEICLMLDGSSDGFVRILDRNLFRLLFNQRVTNEEVRLCKYTSNGYFYAVSEDSSGDEQIGTTHYLYNTSDGTSNIVSSTNAYVANQISSSDSPTVSPIELEYPVGGETLVIDSNVEIKWKSNKSVTDLVRIVLLKGGQEYLTITSSTANTGIYGWTVPESVAIASNYRIKVQWISSPLDDANADISTAVFAISDAEPSTSEETISLAEVIGVGYDEYNNQTVIVLRSGYVGFFRIANKTFKGWLKFDINDVNTAVVRNERLKMFDGVTKTRIFVGSAPYLNDMWDSGEISTNKRSMYYGGGNNLRSGETYYVNIQVYSSGTGWSEVQTKSFTMP